MHWIDPDCLPEISGTVESFVVNSHGEIDGLVINDDARNSLLVHVPPHLTPEIETSIRPGDAVKVRGVRPRGANVFAAVSIACTDGQVILDEGPDHKSSEKKDGADTTPKHSKTKRDMGEAAGTVRLSLYAPKGELRGAILDDGTALRVGPKEARRFEALLSPGASVAVRGEVLQTEHGRVVEVRDIGRDAANLTPVKDHKDRKDRKEPQVEHASGDLQPEI
jgi:hypothetical protein